jgi:hypothetical protein
MSERIMECLQCQKILGSAPDDYVVFCSHSCWIRHRFSLIMAERFSIRDGEQYSAHDPRITEELEQEWQRIMDAKIPKDGSGERLH